MKRNKIIAISGQPVTGKGTTVKALDQKLIEQGYIVHIISTGHEFRDYFNSIFDFIKSYKDSEQIESFKENRYLKDLLEKKEYREALIKTILKIKNSRINIDELNIENANNLKEFSGLRKVIDTVIDTKTEEIVREFDSEERPNEALILDSRVAFMINNKLEDEQKIFSVRLISNPQVAAERLFNDKNRGKEDNNYTSVEEAYDAREKRRIGEQQRYIRRYGVNLEDENNYHLIIDTSYSTTDDIADTILTCLESYIEGKDLNKKCDSRDLEDR